VSVQIAQRWVVAALRPTVAPEAVVIETPVPAPRARVVERDQHFPGKAIVADPGDGPFDAPFGESCRLLLMRGLRIESFLSPTPFTR